MKWVAASIIVVIVLGGLTTGQNGAQPRYRWQQVFENKHVGSCDEKMNFCFYGPFRDGSDEFSGWGNRWMGQDKKDSRDELAEVRCLKDLHRCIIARTTLHLSRLEIELYTTQEWNTSEIRAASDDHNWLQHCNIAHQS
jgi:hypothetical protein